MAEDDGEVSREQFAGLFARELERAVRVVEMSLGHPVGRPIRVRLGSPNTNPTPPDQAVDALYLGPNRFFRAIELAVVELGPNYTDVMASPSGHAPGPFSRTASYANGGGPFTHALAQEIRAT
jgi:hypothetical protein